MQNVLKERKWKKETLVIINESKTKIGFTKAALRRVLPTNNGKFEENVDRLICNGGKVYGRYIVQILMAAEN